MSERDFSADTLQQMLQYLESAEASLRCYEALKESEEPALDESITNLLSKREKYIDDCLQRIKFVKRDLEQAIRMQDEYDHFAKGALLRLIYGPPEVMGRGGSR